MILDDVFNLQAYVSLNARFARVAHYLQHTDLAALPLGHHQIEGEDIFVNIVESAPKSREEAAIETHNQMIDIQVPISAPEEHGWVSRHQLPEANYDADNDIAFYDGLATNYFHVNVGQFVIYFPADGHAPAITPVPIRKAIFKVKV